MDIRKSSPKLTNHKNDIKIIPALLSSGLILTGLLTSSADAQVLELPQELLEIIPTDGQAPFDLTNTTTEILDDATPLPPALSGSAWTTHTDEGEVHALTADIANSSNAAHGSSVNGVLNDTFAYDPLNPSATSPQIVWSPTDFYHAYETDGSPAVLSFTLASPLTITVGLKEIQLDLWGRNIVQQRDDDIDILLCDGSYTNVVGQINGISIPDTADAHITVSLQSLPFGTSFDRIQIVGNNTSGNSTNTFTLAELRLATKSNYSTLNDENKVILASIDHDVEIYPSGTKHSLIPNLSNSSAAAFGSSVTGTANDSFSYDPENPTATTPTIAWSSDDFYHAYLTDNSDAVLAYTLSETLTTSNNDIDEVVMDFWGRNVHQDRDNDFDIYIYDGNFSSPVASITGLAIPDSSNPHLRVNFADYIASGISFDRIKIIGHNSQTGTINRFTLAETRLATITTATGPDDYSSFEMRIAQSGCVYSLKNPMFDEAVPPQYKSTTSGSPNMNPWIDEVFQLVQVKTDATGTPYYLHQAGTYQNKDWLAEPFYSPLLASGKLDDNTFVTINWLQHGHIDFDTGINEHGSYSMGYTKYRVIASGVVEVTMLAYNYGTDVLNWFNVPWGGVRDTAFGEILVGDNTTDGSIQGTFLEGRPKWSENNMLLTNHPGWFIYAQTRDESAASLGLVVGADFAQGGGVDFLRVGYIGTTQTDIQNETTSRNYQPVSVIRRQQIGEDDYLFARFYYVVGSTAQIKQKIEDLDLLAKCTVEQRSGFATSANTFTWRRSASGAMPTLSGNDPILCQVLDKPTGPNYKPVFLIEYNGDFIPTYDPYKYTGGRPYLNYTNYIGLLGYADTNTYSESDLN